jgi:enoyl-CoA hydratase/carnithine racemase
VATSQAQRVEVESVDGVAEVRLCRPEKLNALDQAMFVGLVEAADALRMDPTVRAVVISGEGRGFCAGLDLGYFEEMGRDEPAGRLRTPAPAGGLGARLPGRNTNLAQEAVVAWSRLAVPTIAAVHGVAFGGGLQLALGTDLRIVAPDAELSVLEIRWGLVPDMSGTWLLPRLVGPDVAKDLAWTGRIVDGKEAVRLGLATRCAEDPRAAALEAARTIARANPDAIRAAKALLGSSMTDTFDQHLLRESSAMGALIGSPNQAEAVRAWFEKRSPVFADPTPD